MPCWNNTAKIAIGSSIVGAATIAMIVIIFTAASWTTPVLWIELIGIGIIGLIGLLWIIIIAVQHRSALRRHQNQAVAQMAAQEANPPQQQFRPTRAPQLPTTGYSPKLRDDKDKTEITMKEITPPASTIAQAGSAARVTISTTEEDSTGREAAGQDY
eukprot:TRINITY_DN4714_c0_g1_i1.p1 TRINITY_DN4714_c0_g1~~TRINITY_DN4714_c0_g1_i1.p1  ORF type:complete len:158 (+),score=3.13 TRINITY_DN4714_c0_g1_i1:61-534(+)